MRIYGEGEVGRENISPSEARLSYKGKIRTEGEARDRARGGIYTGLYGFMFDSNWTAVPIWEHGN